MQSEWYKEHDYNDFLNGVPSYVVFNSNDFSLKEKPMLAKAGDKVRFYVNNAGPNEVSSFHEKKAPGSFSSRTEGFPNKKDLN